MSRILAGLYLVLPPLSAAVVAWRFRRSHYNRATRRFAVTCGSGAVLGTALALVYAAATGGRAPFGQIALTSYVCIGILCLLKGLSWLLREGTERLLRVRVPADQRGGGWVARAALALTLRVVLLFAVGLPYIMAVAMVYRPKVVTADTPLHQLGFRYEPVQFTAADGVSLDGWWIPAKDTPPAGSTARGESKPPGWGERTVILCHGLGADKANQLLLVRDLVPNGFNVLTFDFRAHGASGGQISSFGDLERRDVLGAVHWLRANRPNQSKQIDGLGISMGAAALLAASADPTPDGRAIDRVAVYDTYDDLGSLAQSMSDKWFAPPLNWLAEHIALPLASAHAGANLAAFSPAREADALAPRPLLVIHARGDEVIDFRHGVRLFEQASEPKLRMWIGKLDNRGHYRDRQKNLADHNNVILNDDAATAVRLFFEGSGPVL